MTGKLFAKRNWDEVKQGRKEGKDKELILAIKWYMILFLSIFFNRSPDLELCLFWFHIGFEVSLIIFDHQILTIY